MVFTAQAVLTVLDRNAEQSHNLSPVHQSECHMWEKKS